MRARACRTRLVAVSVLLVLLVGGFGGYKHTAEGATAPQTHTVDENGTYGYNSIQTAIDTASPGDTIRVLEGYYEENLVVDKSLSIIGDGANRTVIDGRLEGVGIRVISNDTTISDIKVINCRGDFYLYPGILIRDCHDVLVENCWTLNNEIGITIFSADRVTVKNNTIQEDEDCILLANVTNSTFHDNRISTDDGTCLLLDDCSYISIYHNYCDSRTGGGMYTSNCGNMNIEYNVLWPYNAAMDLNYTTNSGQMSGIELYRTNSSLIANNQFWPGLAVGMYLEYSGSNIITHNSFSEAQYGGISLMYSGNCTVKDNILTNCSTGLYADQAWGLTCTGNTLTRSGFEVKWDDVDIARSQVIDDTNTVNGRPVYRLIDGENMDAPNDVGQMILINCTNVTVEGYSCNNTSTSIQLFRSENCTIINSTCTNNSYAGISAVHCRNLIVEGNDFSGNYHGIYMYASGDEKEMWNINRVRHNTCRYNHYGIWIHNSVSDTIYRNTIEYNIVGITALRVQYLNIDNNTVSYNTDGIICEMIDDTNLRGNICEHNDGTGIDFQMHSDHSRIDENTCSNNGVGIHIFRGNANVVEDNIITNNEAGLEVSTSSHHLICRNSLKTNSISAEFSSCDSQDDHSGGIKFYENTVEENEWGVYLVNSRFMSVYDNMIARNTETGLLIHHTGSVDNLIYHNNIIDNNIQAMDMGDNTWASPMGEGGNYWSDYEGVDNGSWPRNAGDNIGDTNIPHLDVDFFPYLNESGWDYPCVPALYGPEADGDGKYDLWWSTGRANQYVVEEDDGINFTSPVEVYRGWNLSCNVSGRPEGEHYYRIRAGNREMETNWSGPLVVIVDHSLIEDDDGGDDRGDTTDANSLAWAIAILAIMIVIGIQYRSYLRARVGKDGDGEEEEDDEGRGNVVEKRGSAGDKGK